MGGGGVPYPILFSSCRISGTRIEHYLVVLVKRGYIILCKKMCTKCEGDDGDGVDNSMTPMH